MSSTQTTKTAQINPGGGIESLAWGNRRLPDPGDREVRIRIRAVSLNYRDLAIASGHYPLTHSRPLVPVSDGAGTVEAVGSAVTRVQVGDRVSANFVRDWVSGTFGPAQQASSLGGEVDGMLAEYVVLPEHALVPIPESLSFSEAAALPCAGVTAWNAMIFHGRVQAGHAVVVQGTGGVSLFALQIAKHSGARVFATTSNDAKAAKLRALGADLVINYRTTPDWASAVRSHTDGRGADHIVDVGGAGTFEQSLRAVRLGGEISVIGFLAGAAANLNLVPIILNHVRLNGIFVGSREMFEELLRTPIRPVIDRAFPFDQALEAYRYLSSGKHFGKVVIEN
jgi:NADPH:quinone reductase-like Zn-dependent oxidoreductase